MTIVKEKKPTKLYEYIKCILPYTQRWRIDAIIVLGQLYREGVDMVSAGKLRKEMLKRANLPPLVIVKPATEPVIYDFLESLVKCEVCIRKREWPQDEKRVELTETIVKLQEILLKDLNNIS